MGPQSVRMQLWWEIAPAMHELLLEKVGVKVLGREVEGEVDAHVEEQVGRERNWAEMTSGAYMV